MQSSRAVIGVLWSSTQYFGVMIISFISNVVLARLLTPDDFGAVGMLMVFIAIASTFVDSGLGAALIQKTNPTKEDISTVFNVNLLLSGVLYAILFFTAPYIADFYKTPILRVLLRVEGLILFLNAFCIVQTCMLRKQLNFKKLSISNIVGNLAGTAVGIVAAVLGAGVWSLVIRLLVVSATTSVMLWNVSSWRPSWIFSYSSFKELFSFGGFMLLTNLILTISDNIQSLIIGRLFSANTLGYYTQAKMLRDVPVTGISNTIRQVAYPMFSNIKENKIELGNKLLRSVSIIAYLNSALMALFIILGKPLILLVLGDKWLGAVWYFQVLCAGGVFFSLQNINYNVVAATGNSKALFRVTLFQTILGVILCILGGVYFGMDGILYSILINVFIFYCVYAYLGMKVCEMSFFKQFRITIMYILLGIATGVVTQLIMYYIFAASLLASNFIYVVTGTIVYGLIFFIISYLLKFEAFIYCMNIIRRGIKRI